MQIGVKETVEKATTWLSYKNLLYMQGLVLTNKKKTCAEIDKSSDIPHDKAVRHLATVPPTIDKQLSYFKRGLL